MIDNQTHAGFALLVALIVIGAVLSVGLVMLDLTIKQVQLAGTTKDSEIAFHAANAGMECAQFWRRETIDDLLTGGAMSNVSCFGSTPENVTRQNQTSMLTDGGLASLYEYQFSWGPTDERRCTMVDQVFITNPLGGNNTSIINTDMQQLISGYPTGSTMDCPAGARCTTLAVRGYNQACPAVGDTFGFGVVERQVLLEF